MRPDELASALADGSPMVLPIGALEWHGPHLPLGLDGLVAEAFSRQLADRANGVVLPTFYTPITTLPHPYSLQMRTSTMQAVLDETIAGLQHAGATRVCLVTGHYAQGHSVELSRAAIRAMNRFGGFLVFAASPLEPLGDEHLLDHAARFEVSQLLAIRPELVRLDLLESLDPRRSAVLGEDPSTASAEEGRELMNRALATWSHWVREADRAELLEFYEERIEAYRPYMDRYLKGSWEEAIVDWWDQKVSG